MSGAVFQEERDGVECGFGAGRLGRGEGTEGDENGIVDSTAII
jgi:hypothetical protein